MDLGGGGQITRHLKWHAKITNLLPVHNELPSSSFKERMDMVRFSLSVGHSTTVWRDRGTKADGTMFDFSLHCLHEGKFPSDSLIWSSPSAENSVCLGKGSAARFKWRNKGLLLIPVESKVSAEPQ